MAPGAVEMTFAEKQLAKYGWKKGMGLGKMNNGISAPIKVKTCKNNLGIGNDPKKHFSHWWDMAYNRAVNNIIVGRSENGNIEVTRSSECSITQEKPNVFNTNVLYDDFQKAGPLKGIQFTSNSKSRDGCDSSDSEGDLPGVSRGQGLLLDMTDAELLKLCGGGTAHKGARHGIRMGGKMKRLKAMEEADAARAAQQRQAELVPANAVESVNHLGTGDKKDIMTDGKSKKSCTEDKEGEISVGQDSCKEAEVPKMKKSKKEKNKNCRQIETYVGTKNDTEPEIDGEEDSAIELSSDEPNCKHMKKKKRKREDIANMPLDAHEISAESPIVPLEMEKKNTTRKLRKKYIVDAEIESQQTVTDSSAKLERKKVKKNKSIKQSSEAIYESKENVINTELNTKYRADNASLERSVILEVDPSSEERRRKKKKRKKQISENHAC